MTSVGAGDVARRVRGPAALFAAWALHDVEEAITFPATAALLARRTGIDALRMSPAQSWAAVGLMAPVIAAACLDGVRRGGRSTPYRTAVAGLEAHVLTHLAASAVTRGYTAGVLTAVPIMLPGARYARAELRRAGTPPGGADLARGLAVLLPAAVLCQVGARRLVSGRRVRTPDEERRAERG